MFDWYFTSFVRTIQALRLNIEKKNCMMNVEDKGLRFEEISETAMNDMLTSNRFNITLNNDTLIVSLQEINTDQFAKQNNLLQVNLIFSAFIQ